MNEFMYNFIAESSWSRRIVYSSGKLRVLFDLCVLTNFISLISVKLLKSRKFITSTCLETFVTISFELEVLLVLLNLVSHLDSTSPFLFDI